jgi:glycosyltransferase involved in cell wall biosynthesis
MSPLVSVIITTYNHEPFIATAIRSVLVQTYRDYEIIVVDDGSTDGTASQVSAFSDRIISVRQRNQGVAGSRNAGIRKATGYFLTFLDGDDVWEPEKLVHHVAAAEAHPRSGLIAVDGVQFSGDSIILGSLFGPAVTSQLAGRESFTLKGYEELLRANFISTTSQVLIPRPVFDVVGLSDRRFPICSDWDLYLRIAARYDITLVNRKLVLWRYLDSSASGADRLRFFRWATDEIPILRKHLRRSPVSCRPLVRGLLKEKILATAFKAYYCGEAERAWSKRYLLRLYVRNPASLVIASYLAAHYLPRRLIRVLSESLRRLVDLSPKPPRR